MKNTIYCVRCESNDMELISQTISKDILAKRVKIWNLYKCYECGMIRTQVKRSMLINNSGIDSGSEPFKFNPN